MNAEEQVKAALRVIPMVFLREAELRQSNEPVLVTAIRLMVQRGRELEQRLVGVK